MNEPHHRRAFLHRLAATSAGLGLASLPLSQSRAPAGWLAAEPLFKISLAEWSLHRAIFAGKVDHLKLGFPWKQMLAYVKEGSMADGDHRDWDAIRAWAREIAPELRSAGAREPGRIAPMDRPRGSRPLSPAPERSGGKAKGWNDGLLFWCVAGALLVAVGLLFIRPNREALRNEVRERDQARAEVERQREKNRRLSAGLEALEKGDAVAWERLVRREFGWVEPGELPAPEVELPVPGATAPAPDQTPPDLSPDLPPRRASGRD